MTEVRIGVIRVYWRFLLGRGTKKPSRVQEIVCILISLVVIWVYTFVKLHALKISALCRMLYSKGWGDLPQKSAKMSCPMVLKHKIRSLKLCKWLRSPFDQKYRD